MSSVDLAHLLRAQATPPPHRIALDDSLGFDGLSALVEADLARPDGVLYLDVAGPEAIPIPPDPSVTTLTFPVTVPPGRDGFLGLDGAQATLTLLVGAATNDLELAIPLPDSWRFSTSFPEITALPYDELSLRHQSLTLSTGATGTAPRGLDFSGDLALTGLFGTVAELLGIEGSYPVAGLISGNGMDLAFDLQGSLGLEPPPTVAGVLTLAQAGVGVTLTPLKRGDVVDRLVQLYLGATVRFQNVEGDELPLDLRAMMPISRPDGPVITLSVAATPGFEASLGSLGDLLFGQTWDAFFDGPAKSIGELLDVFGLHSYAITVPATTDCAPTAMALDVGTLAPWQMWPGGPSLDQISVIWTVMWLRRTALSQVVMAAQFSYPPTGDDGIRFELTIDSDLNIEGQETGSLGAMSLAGLNDLAFGGAVVIPEDLLTVEVENFTLAVNVYDQHYTFGATASASVGLFGTQVLGIRDMAMSMAIDASTEDLTYTGTLDGEVFLGSIAFHADAVISDQPGVDTVFTLHLVDETVGSMLDHFVHLVDPTFDVSLPAPWDAFLDVSLDAFVLTVNVTTQAVQLTWQPPRPIDLGFLTIDGVALGYTAAAGGRAARTEIGVTGTFLGVRFPDDGNELAWDPINEAPPAVPGQGGALFDLEYAGLGQHVALAGDPDTMDAIMDQLIATASPIQPGALPPFGTDLVFSGDSSWLIGAQFTVMDTVSIKAVFNDPALYGLVVTLAGDKAQSFAGLRFEILYRKISDSLGVYHAELELPDRMRHLEFGELSLTLPVVAVDIYTNGNFRVDFGFPKGLDFSRSFSLQLFPFVGYGGFYLALLSGATSSRVPQITNGTFSPVIEFGVALSIGVGKDVDEGILKGGMSVTVVGILEGVLAWFNPTDSAPAETYYWVKGTIAVTGHLYASVDFGIVQASVDVTAYLSATLVVESHEPIYIEASASVSVRVSVKIVFVRIHLSFHATVDASFTIGSASATPWTVAPGAQSSDGPRRLLRGQRTIHAPAPLVHPGRFKAVRRALVAAQDPPPITSWPAVCVLPGGRQTVPIEVVSAFTKAQAWAVASAARSSGTTTVTTYVANDLAPGDQVTLTGVAAGALDGTFVVASAPSRTTFTVAGPGADVPPSAGGTATAGAATDVGEAILLLTAATSIAPEARTLRAQRTVVGDDPATLPFNVLMQAMLGWGVHVETNQAIGSATRAGGTATFETAAPHNFLPGTGVTVSGVADASFDGSFTIASVPTATSFTVAQAGGAATTTGGVAASALVTAAQLEDLRQQLRRPETVDAAFDYDTLTAFLAQNCTFDLRHEASEPVSAALFPMIPELTLTDTEGTSVDFATQTPVPDGYVDKVRAYFALLKAQASGAPSTSSGPAQASGAAPPSMATVLFTQYFAMLMSAGVQAAIDLLAAYPYTTPSGPGAQPMSIAEVGAAIGDAGGLVADPLRVVVPNQDAAVLEAGALIDLPDVVRQVRAGDTFASIAGQLAAAGARGAGGASPYAAGDLLAANPDAPVFATGVALPLAGLPYTTNAQDTVNLVATRLLVRVGGAQLLGRLSGLQPAVSALVDANHGLDPDATIPAGTAVELADGTTYAAVDGDTLTLVAAYGLATSQGAIALADYAAALHAANPGLPSGFDTPIGAGTTVLYAPLQRAMALGDTVVSLARTLMTTQAAVGGVLLGMPAPVLAPQAVLHAPLIYEVGAGDTFSAVAAKLDVTLTTLADHAARSAGLFAPGASLTISDVPAIDEAALMADLLTNAEWNNAAGQASRFMLSGLRLPDPADPAFEALTPAELLDPRTLAGIATSPTYRLTGQQYPLGSTIPPGYAITLAKNGAAAWVTLAGSPSTPLQYTLSDDERRLFDDLAVTPMPDDLETLTRLELFRMAPNRVALQTQIAWQAAAVPPSCLPAGTAAGNPSVWTFPGALLAELEVTATANGGGGAAYEVVTAKQTQAGASVTASEAGAYAWATLVDLDVSLPVVDGPSESVSNAYVVDGADDAGAALLQQVCAWLAEGHHASLYLLRPPDAAGSATTGMASDVLDPAGTFVLKTNLSTVTHGRQARLRGLAGAPLSSDVLAAPIADTADFVALLWEASVTRSGGFYLEYATADGGAPLPASAFRGTATARLALLVVPEQHGPWRIQDATAAGAVRASGTTTIATTSAHGLEAGDQVTVAGVADASFDGTFTVAAVPSAWTLTYAQTGGDATSGGGTASPGSAVVPSPGVLPFQNCAVIGDNVDPSVSSVFVQPATWSAQPGDDLESVAAGYTARWGTAIGPGDVATLNATVPQVLAVGQAMRLPGGGSVPIEYGDTFASIAAAHGTTPDALGALNAAGPIVAPGAQLQFADGVLRPSTTAPPGVAGFELTRTNPEAGADGGDQTPPQEVAQLFNLVGWSLTAGGGFVASGAGLPTTPTGPLVLASDGLTAADPDAGDDASWYYQQALSVAPFGTSVAGSASPALPPAAADPYNGIAAAGARQDATVALTLQDVYGNVQPLAAPTVSMPVGYYDDLAGPGSWPSLAISYLVAGSPTTIALDMTMQQSRYVPTASVAVTTAQAATAADLQTYTRVHYQLAQPDVAFSLQTTLSLGDDGTPVTYPLPKTPLRSFAYGAYVYLQALSTATAVEVTADTGGLTVAALVDDFGVTAQQLFAANQAKLYRALFGAEQIAVPQLYATVQGDTIAGIAQAHQLSVTAVAEANADVPLDPGTVLAASTRTVTAAAPAGEPGASAVSLRGVADAAHTAATDVATSNARTGALLVAGTVLALGTKTTKVQGDGDTLAAVADRLGGTVEQVGAANAAVPLLRVGVTLTVGGVLVREGDSLTRLAAIPGVGTVDALATANAGVANAFAPATSLLVGTDPQPVPPEPSDTLSSYALANGISVEALGGANATGRFAAGATVAIPAALRNDATAQFCTYSAPEGTTMQAIADLFATTPATLVALNPDLPGLLVAGQRVVDGVSGASVTTVDDDTFQALVDRFAAEGATVSLDQLAADVAAQPGLVAAGGLWICPPMRGDAHGANRDASLSGLAAAYHADATALATANAATLGLLSSEGTVTVGGVSYAPRPHDTLNSLVNRFAALGVTTTLAEVIGAALDVPDLVAPDAAVLPVPPPSPTEAVQVRPRLVKAVSQLVVNVVESRDPTLVDPDFEGTPSIVRSTVTLAPDPDPGSTATTLALTDFATALERALPGLHVATGDPAGEEDPASATAIWLVNFGARDVGPTLTYSLDAARTTCYALPPLSCSLLGDDVAVEPYLSGQDPPFGPPQPPESFRNVDLDAWLGTFLGAVDLFLSPAYAVPAYALDPDSTLAIVQAKELLAQRLAERTEVVLDGDAGTAADAMAALYQAMLTRLSAAYTVNTLVQLPVTVSQGGSDPATAPRLSGGLVPAGGQPAQAPQAYSLSTGKVSLAQGASTATFLLTVKAPAAQRYVELDVDFAVSALELPQPGETIGDYQGSAWLTFVNQVTATSLGTIEIPVPLRAYPGPVTLAAQTASQSVPEPVTASDLLPWDLAFVYQHDDAEQDTPLVEVALNTSPNDPGIAATTDVVVEQVFRALAQFTSVYPAVKADLAMLPVVPAGESNPAAMTAVKALRRLVAAVTAAFEPPPEELGGPFQPPPETLYYQLQKELTGEPATLDTLVVSAVDPLDGTSPATPLWPAEVWATYAGETYQLKPGPVTATTASFSYPPGTIPGDAPVAQRFVFQWPSATRACTARATPPPPSVPATLVGPQTFQFLCVNVLSEQSARAGVSIWRNLELIRGRTTNGAFVYRTPVSSFSASAIPSIATGPEAPLALGGIPTPVGEALGTFLQQLLTTQNTWAPGETLGMRLSGGYTYAVAASGTQTVGPTVPIFLVASADFDPSSDWDWAHPQSFVSQVQAVVSDWISTRRPAARDAAAIVFDMTIYASGTRQQPLIRAASLRYAL